MQDGGNKNKSAFITLPRLFKRRVFKRKSLYILEDACAVSDQRRVVMLHEKLILLATCREVKSLCCTTFCVRKSRAADVLPTFWRRNAPTALFSWWLVSRLWLETGTFVLTTKHGPADVLRHSSSSFIRKRCSSGLSHSSGSTPQYRSTTWAHKRTLILKMALQELKFNILSQSSVFPKRIFGFLLVLQRSGLTAGTWTGAELIRNSEFSIVWHLHVHVHVQVTQHATCVLPTLVSLRAQPSPHTFSCRLRLKESEVESRWGVGEAGIVRSFFYAPLPAGPASSNEFSCGTMTGRSPALLYSRQLLLWQSLTHHSTKPHH